MNDNTEIIENVTAEVTDTAETAPEQPVTEKKDRRSGRAKKDIFDIKKDIRYRGPLSYMHFKLLGWICIVLSQVAIVEGLKQHNYGGGNAFFINREIMSFIESMALPLILISVFAFLLKKRDNYKNALIVYGSLAIGIILLSVFIYDRYVIGLVHPLLNIERGAVSGRLNEILYTVEDYKGFVPFNIFIDVFLCTLIMFFLDYDPKHFFTGKKLLIFRSLVILPLAYEVMCIILKIMASDHLIELPLWFSPMLTTKPPVSVLMFVSIIRYIKIREKQFLDSGRTVGQYKDYLKTNINSFQFAKHLIVIILIYSVLDAVLLVLLSAIHIVVMNMTVGAVVSTEASMAAMQRVYEWGFGGTASMIALIPLVLLFSYTRSNKLEIIDSIIPFAGVVAIGIVYIDGFFQIFQHSLGSLSSGISEIAGMLENAVF